MKLLADIIESALGISETLPFILRKCLVLAYQLKNDRLKSWVEKELNGYNDGDDLPEYRIVRASAKGLFLGEFGNQIVDQPIPPGLLDKRHRHFAEKVKLKQPIAAYDERRLDTGDDESTAIIEWPPNLTVFYQSKIFKEYTLNRAWQEIPGSAIVSLRDTIRTRILTFSLELKDELGENSDSEAGISKIPSPKVDTIVTNYIFGGNNVISSTANEMQIDARQQVVVGDIRDLKRAIKEIGLHDEDIHQLEAALNEDTSDQVGTEPSAIGVKTESWVKRSAKKLGVSGMKVGEAVAAKVLEGIIKGYLGVP